MNEEILAPKVRLIDHEGKQVGIATLREALNSAREVGLDLVEVSPNADPPVCKILDWGKFQYLQMKRQREARKGQKITEVKEVRLRPKTDDYHAGFKVRNARRFLMDGMKVKVRVQFKGREITYPEIALQQLKEVADALADIADVEQKPNLDGRTMLMVLAPNQHKKEQKTEAKAKHAASLAPAATTPASGESAPVDGMVGTDAGVEAAEPAKADAVEIKEVEGAKPAESKPVADTKVVEVAEPVQIAKGAEAVETATSA